MAKKIRLMGKIEFKSSFELFGRIEFPSKRTKQACCSRKANVSSVWSKFLMWHISRRTCWSMATVCMTSSTSRTTLRFSLSWWGAYKSAQAQAQAQLLTGETHSHPTARLIQARRGSFCAGWTFQETPEGKCVLGTRRWVGLIWFKVWYTRDNLNLECLYCQLI